MASRRHAVARAGWSFGRRAAVVGAAGVALVLSACGGGDDGDNGEDGGQAGGPTGAVVISGCNPQNPLVPANTNETCGGNPQQQGIFSMLVRYDPDTAAPQMEIAESIESDDNITWTVTLKDGWTFHDGSPITANSFVDAWNFSALGENGYLSSYFFEPIEGFAEVQGEFDDEGAYIEGSATAETMSGLEVVDDRTFTITLTSPQSAFPQRLGYTAFAPLPEVFYDDPDAFGDHPIGSGPFEMVAWNQNVDIQLTAYDGYAGDVKPSVQDVTFRIYTDLNAAYSDLLADNVDVIESLPPTALVGEQYKADLGDRYIEADQGAIQTITFAPERVDPTVASTDLRKGLSMAIDRDLITQEIFQGQREPATGWVSPVVDGYLPEACGEFCTYDPEAASELVAASGFTGTLTLSYNADADHAGWTEATCNSIRNATGVDCVATPVVDFATFRGQITDRQMPGMFRTGWQMDYPHIENFLVPLYATGASANDGDYSNPDLDAKLNEAAAAPTEEALALYQEAEQMLAEDMPSIPLWYYKTIAGYSSNVDNVKIDPFGTTDLLSITLAE